MIRKTLRQMLDHIYDMTKLGWVVLGVVAAMQYGDSWSFQSPLRLPVSAPAVSLAACADAMAEANRRAVRISTSTGNGSGVMLDERYLLIANHQVSNKDSTTVAVDVTDPHGRWQGRALLAGFANIRVPLPRPKPLPGRASQPMQYLMLKNWRQVLELDFKTDQALLRLLEPEPLLAGLKPVKLLPVLYEAGPLAMASSKQGATRLGMVRGQSSDTMNVNVNVVPGDSGSGVYACREAALVGVAVRVQPMIKKQVGAYPVWGNGTVVAPAATRAFLQKHWPGFAASENLP